MQLLVVEQSALAAELHVTTICLVEKDLQKTLSSLFRWRTGWKSPDLVAEEGRPSKEKEPTSRQFDMRP